MKTYPHQDQKKSTLVLERERIRKKYNFSGEMARKVLSIMLRYRIDEQRAIAKFYELKERHNQYREKGMKYPKAEAFYISKNKNN